MALDVLKKTEYDAKLIRFIFNKNMVTGETITVYTVIAADKDGVDSSEIVFDQATKVLDMDDQAVKILVRAGEKAKSYYLMECRVETSGGQKFELEVELRIVDRTNA